MRRLTQFIDWKAFENSLIVLFLCAVLVLLCLYATGPNAGGPRPTDPAPRSF